MTNISVSGVLRQNYCGVACPLLHIDAHSCCNAVSNLCIRCIGATLYVTMVTVTNTFSKWNLQFFLYTLGKRIVFFLLPEAFCMWPKICRKCDSGRGSATDPAGGAHDVPPDSLVGWGAATPPHTPPYSAPRSSCPTDTKSWRRHWSSPLFR